MAAGAITTSEWACPVVAILLFVAYHVQLYRSHKAGLKKSDSHGLKTRVFMAQIRKAWVERNHKKDLYAIQVLRDFQRTLSFYAQSSFLATLLSSGYTFNLKEQCTEAGDLCSDQEKLLIAKLAIMSCVLGFTFFNHLMSLRFMVHLSFLFNIDSIDTTDGLTKIPITPRILLRIFERMTWQIHLGYRGIYASIPIAAWILNDWVLLATTMTLIYVLHKIDTANFTLVEPLANNEGAEAVPSLVALEEGSTQHSTKPPHEDSTTKTSNEPVEDDWALAFFM